MMHVRRSEKQSSPLAKILLPVCSLSHPESCNPVTFALQDSQMSSSWTDNKTIAQKETVIFQGHPATKGQSQD